MAQLTAEELPRDDAAVDPAAAVDAHLGIAAIGAGAQILGAAAFTADL